VSAKVIYLAIIIVGSVASFSLARNLYSTYGSSKYLEQAQAKLDRLRAENQDLLRENAEARDPSFIEREARERLGLVKPGEVVVILPEKEAAAGATEEPAAPARPIWQQWLGLFLDG
jgi:cell division protein DivIC